jgi:ribosomal RNA-processing protein 9
MDLSCLRADRIVSVGGRDKTARWFKIKEETQLVFRGGGGGSKRKGLEVDEEEEVVQGEEERFDEGSLDCCAMVDGKTFLTGGDSGSGRYLLSSLLVTDY